MSRNATFFILASIVCLNPILFKVCMLLEIPKMNTAHVRSSIGLTPADTSRQAKSIRSFYLKILIFIRYESDTYLATVKRN